MADDRRLIILNIEQETSDAEGKGVYDKMQSVHPHLQCGCV